MIRPMFLRPLPGAERKILTAALLLVGIAAVHPAQAAGVVSTCDQTHLQTALSGGGLVTFTCGGDIALTSTLIISLNTTVDATGQTVTLDGQHSIQVLSINSGVALTVNNLTLASGSSSQGGAVSNNGTLIVNKSTFTGNNVTNLGGAIWSNGTLIVNSTTFSGNTSGFDAGAIWVNNGAVGYVNNSTFSGNNASVDAGAIYNLGTLTINSSTFSGNTTSNDSGGGAILNTASVTLTNTILANSTTGQNCSGTITDSGYNLSDDTSCNFTATGSTNGDTSINLGSFSNGVFPLSSGSNAVAAIPPGVNGCATTILTDQIGQARPGSLNGNCSIGAWEYVAPVTSTITNCADDSQLQAAMSAGGRIVFACSGDIKLTQTLVFQPGNTALDATGFQVTLDGTHTYEVFVGSFSGPPSLILNNLTVANGANDSDGGAIYCFDQTIITNSTFLNNGGSNSFAGAIWNDGGTLIISNSTFSGNSANTYGGAIFSDGDLVLTNSTISGNSAATGGAIYTADTPVTFQNTVLANNAGGNCTNDSGTLIDAGYNLDDDGTCGFSSANLSLSNDKNANLGSLSSKGGPTQTIPLQYPSDAIDFIPLGMSGCGMSPDQRGVFRPQGTACDIGAYEANQIPVSFATNPPNLFYTVGSANYTAAGAPFLIVGAQYTIGTTSPQSGGTGTQYMWQTWSDDGAQSHSITIPSGPASYTADFQTQYLLTTAVNPSGSGSVGVSPTSTNGYYAAGTAITLTASSNSGYAFANWTGTTSSTTNPLIFDITSPASETANFTSVAQVKVTVASNPSGLSITVDGQTYSSPQTFTWVQNSEHTIATTSPQTLTGVQYAFVNWSDRGALSHQITASANATYTVTFNGFTITPNPSSETISRGLLAAFALQLKSLNGFQGNVKLSCSGGPAGSYCGDLPETILLHGQALAVSGIFFPTSTKPGTYTVTFNGTSSPLTETGKATFTVK